MNSHPLVFFIAILLLLVCACKDSQPTEPQKPSLTVSSTQVTIARNYDRYLSVQGGVGPLHVKSISDSSIVLVSFTSIENINGVFIHSVRFSGRTLGTAVVTLQDSAHEAEVSITITVAAMAFSWETVTIQEYRSYFSSIYGGTPPYTLEGNSNPAVATGYISSSSISINAQLPGVTVITVRDSDSPAHTAALTVIVTPKPVFTTPGRVSFSSIVGDFSANGIAVENIVPLPPNAEGAGGKMQGIGRSYVECSFMAYKKKSQNIVDVMVIMFRKSGIGVGPMPISYRSGRVDSAYVWFVINGDLNSPTADIQKFSYGSIHITAFTDKVFAGTFRGSGQIIKNDTPVPGQQFTVSDGTFSLPILLEDYSPSARYSKEQISVEEYVKNIMKHQRQSLWNNTDGE